MKTAWIKVRIIPYYMSQQNPSICRISVCWCPLGVDLPHRELAAFHLTLKLKHLWAPKRNQFVFVISNDQRHFWCPYTKDAGTPSYECSLSEFWQAAKLLALDMHQKFQFCNGPFAGWKYGSILIPDILQMLFGYRHYAHRKCPTSFGHYSEP